MKRHDPGKRYAVITGDIIASSNLVHKEKVRLDKVLKQVFSETKNAFPDAIPLEIDVFSGDRWQLLISEPVKSLRIGLFFRACLKSMKIDTRMAIALGRIDYFPEHRVSEGFGEAFTLSGKALDQLSHYTPRSKAGTLKLLIPQNDLEQAISTIVLLIDELASRWTAKQALAITGALQGWNQERIAKLWEKPIKQPTLVAHLKVSGWTTIKEALRFIEEKLSSS